MKTSLISGIVISIINEKKYFISSTTNILQESNIQLYQLNIPFHTFPTSWS